MATVVVNICVQAVSTGLSSSTSAWGRWVSMAHTFVVEKNISVISWILS